MFEQITDIQITGVVFGESTLRAEVKQRPSHMLIYKINGESIYHLRGNKVHFSAGTLLYVPEGESYFFEKISDGESRYCSINFHASFAAAQEPHLFSPQATENIYALYKQMETRWRLCSDEAEHYEILSLFMHLVSVLLRSRQSSYLTTAQKNRLLPALQYLEKNIFDDRLQIHILANLCGMSEVTFRNVFQKRFGEPPKKYIIKRRLLQARAIMESGEYTSISEIARRVGYDDPLYFSRLFKSFFGFPPSKC